MDTTESIILIAAVAVVSFWYGKKKASKASAQANSTTSMDWLGNWSPA